jgi:hypothetical protein|tara:strand:- start:7343 stop:7615 length:273 start_codon:yes stop_codon:yes gene_type:complete
MFVLTIVGREDEGAYSVQNEEGDSILYLFEEQDDAVRYAMMLEDMDYPEMHVMEVDPAAMLNLCQNYDYEYTVITPNDIVIPPDIEHDFI